MSLRFCAGRPGRTDDVHTILSTYGDISISHQTSRAIVKLAAPASHQANCKLVIFMFHLPSLSLSTLTWVTTNSETSQMWCCLSSMTAAAHRTRRYSFRSLIRLQLPGMGHHTWRCPQEKPSTRCLGYPSSCNSGKDLGKGCPPMVVFTLVTFRVPKLKTDSSGNDLSEPHHSAGRAS